MNCYKHLRTKRLQLRFLARSKMVSTYTQREVWRTNDLVNGNNFHLVAPYACVVLNRKIRIPPDITKNLWENAEIRLTVDGGTNRWHSFLKIYCEGQDMKPPDYITGDFDSIKPQILEYFISNENTKQVHTPDQDETDFTKALKVLKRDLEEKNIFNVVVFQDTSGRLDQIMANFNTLFKCKSIFDRTIRVFLLGGNSLTWLLTPGEHSIHVPKDLVENSRWCALIPIGNKSTVTTTGLKWNLSGKAMEFGGMVSTSNTFASQKVGIRTTGDLLWSMGLYHDD